MKITLKKTKNKNLPNSLKYYGAATFLEQYYSIFIIIYNLLFIFIFHNFTYFFFLIFSNFTCKLFTISYHFFLVCYLCNCTTEHLYYERDHDFFDLTPFFLQPTRFWTEKYYYRRTHEYFRLNPNWTRISDTMAVIHDIQKKKRYSTVAIFWTQFFTKMFFYSTSLIYNFFYVIPFFRPPTMFLVCSRLLWLFLSANYSDVAGSVGEALILMTCTFSFLGHHFIGGACKFFSIDKWSLWDCFYYRQYVHHFKWECCPRIFHMYIFIFGPPLDRPGPNGQSDMFFSIDNTYIRAGRAFPTCIFSYLGHLLIGGGRLIHVGWTNTEP